MRLPDGRHLYTPCGMLGKLPSGKGIPLYRRTYEPLGPKLIEIPLKSTDFGQKIVRGFLVIFQTNLMIHFPFLFNETKSF